MDIKPEGIIKLDKVNLKKASQMLSRAFYDDPFSLFAFPEIKDRDNCLPYMNELSIRSGLRYGKVYTTSERLEGVAVWAPPDRWIIPYYRLILSGALVPMIKMGWKIEKKMYSVLKFIENKHRKLAPFPHWYLALLGVDPQYQKQGYASLLLRGMFEKIDTQNLPCYLETETAPNVAMYQHFGFKVIDEFTIPKTDIRLWLMLRDKNK